MAEDIDIADELRKELETEREKVKRLEELLQKEQAEVAKREGALNEIYQRVMVEGATDKEEIARAIGKEQYDALTYHLAKEHEKRLEAEKKLLGEEEQLRLKEKTIAQDEELLKKDEQKILELENELSEERKKRIELEKQVFTVPQKSTPGGEEFVDDFDLSELESPVKLQSNRPSHYNVTIRDLIKLMLRIDRMKVIDASIMLNTSKQNVLRLAGPLAKKGYIEIENPRTNDPTLRALSKLLRLKRR